MTALASLPPVHAADLLAKGEAALIDLREPDETRRAGIDGAACLPLSRLDRARAADLPPGDLVFFCRSGARVAAAADRLAALAPGRGRVMTGGLDAWRAAGLPVRTGAGAPIEIMRQVQIGAGSLVLLGVVLGLLVAPAFLALAGFVGAGLVLAGASGWCGMARLLGAMPWNRAAAA